MQPLVFQQTSKQKEEIKVTGRGWNQMLSKMNNTLCQAAGSSRVARLTTAGQSQTKTKRAAKGGRDRSFTTLLQAGGSVLSPPNRPLRFSI